MLRGTGAALLETAELSDLKSNNKSSKGLALAERREIRSHERSQKANANEYEVFRTGQQSGWK